MHVAINMLYAATCFTTMRKVENGFTFLAACHESTKHIVTYNLQNWGETFLATDDEALVASQLEGKWLRDT